MSPELHAKIQKVVAENFTLEELQEITREITREAKKLEKQINKNNKELKLLKSELVAGKLPLKNRKEKKMLVR